MIWITIAVFILDRVTKYLAAGVKHFPLIPGVIGICYAENTGMAFGLLEGHPKLLGLLTIVILVLYWFQIRPIARDRVVRVGIGLALGGALGNFVDRMFAGYVTDMILLEFMDFPVFNVADCGVTVGFALILYSVLFRLDTLKKEAQEEIWPDGRTRRREIRWMVKPKK